MVLLSSVIEYTDMMLHLHVLSTTCTCIDSVHRVRHTHLIFSCLKAPPPLLWGYKRIRFKTRLYGIYLLMYYSLGIAMVALTEMQAGLIY